MAVIKDITSKIKDLNAYDRVYRSGHGHTIKVRVEDISASPSIMSFRVTGSWVDDKTGKAKVFNDAPFIVEPHELVVRPDTPTDLPQLLEDARLDMVRRVDLAATNYYAKEALSGVLKNPTSVS